MEVNVQGVLKRDFETFIKNIKQSGSIKVTPKAVKEECLEKGSEEING